MAEGQGKPKSRKRAREESEYGGYDLEFVGEIADRYNCQICTKVIREPHLTVCCGQHFCESCLNRWWTTEGKKSCPHCRADAGASFNHVINKGLRYRYSMLARKRVPDPTPMRGKESGVLQAISWACGMQNVM